MKADLLLTAGGAQVILTPETEVDKMALVAVASMSVVAIKKGEIWGKTQGGYYRPFDERPNNESTLIVLSAAGDTK